MIDNINYSLNLIKSNYLVWLFPLLFILLLFIGCRFAKTHEWNDNYLGTGQAKVLKGFFAIGILLHHLSQRTAAGWLDPHYIIHGLDAFVDIGYFFVAYFLFISGYGLYKSYKTKVDYFKHYFLRRLVPVLLAYLTTSLAYYLYKSIESRYTWYVCAIVLCYLLFYFAYRFIKNENVSLLIVILGLFAYSSYCHINEVGGWFYNTVGLFVIGILFARFENKIVPLFKKIYIPLLLITFILTFVCRYYGLHFEQIVYGVNDRKIYDLYNFLIILFRFIASFNFVMLVLLISLKCEFKNKFLSFISSISLELYLIQGIFVDSFAYCYVEPYIKPLYYIKNIPLYVLVVSLLSIISAIILNYIHKFVYKLLNKVFVK